jgi:rhamnosyltransferase
MQTLVVMAHYDAMGQVAPHVLRHLDALNEVADRLVMVSTAELADETWAKEVETRAELVVRPNYGYDFFSYKTGLDLMGDLTGYDLVILCNDSFVGPLRPYSRIIGEMADRPVDFWGITSTDRRATHVQSYFVAFRPWVVRSQAFTGFWRNLTPVSDRSKVISRYELGLSAALMDGGFRGAGYFEETPADRRLARARHLWWAVNTIGGLTPAKRKRAWRVLPFEPWNPMASLADRALDEGRLPVVKIDTLRYDPYRLESDRLLEACERRFPEQFQGVREYLDRTNALYPPRKGEGHGRSRPPLGLRRLIGYAR